MRSPTVDQTGTRTIAGLVNLDGTTKTGTGGFISAKTSTGIYVVRWTIPVRNPLSIIAAPFINTPFLAVVAWYMDAIGNTGFQVNMYSAAGAITDQPFHFIAVLRT